jgi:hypothetical protein
VSNAKQAKKFPAADQADQQRVVKAAAPLQFAQQQRGPERNAELPVAIQKLTEISPRSFDLRGKSAEKGAGPTGADSGNSTDGRGGEGDPGGISIARSKSEIESSGFWHSKSAFPSLF